MGITAERIIGLERTKPITLLGDHGFGMVEELLSRNYPLDLEQNRFLEPNQSIRRHDMVWILHSLDPYKHILIVAGFKFEDVYEMGSRIFSGLDILLPVYSEQQRRFTFDELVTRMGISGAAAIDIVTRLRERR